MNAKKIKSAIYGLAAFLLLLCLSACDRSYYDAFDNLDDYEYSATFAVPLVNSSFSIEDIIDLEGQGFINVDENNLIWLVYEGRVFSVPAENLFQIPDQSQSFSVTADPSSKNEIVHQEVFTFTFNSDEVLHSATFRRGHVTISLDAQQLQMDGYSVEADYELIGSQTATGEPVTGTVSLQEPAVTDLQGTTLQFTDETNSFEVAYTIRISGEGTPVNAPYTIHVNQQVHNLKYEILYGYVGQINFPIGNTSISLGLFDMDELSDVYFESPYIEVAARNSFGASSGLFFNSFYAVNNGGESLEVQNPKVESGWVIAEAQQPREIATTLEILDRDNTNLDEIIDLRPTEFVYDVYGMLNPNGKPETVNFLRYDSELEVDVTINLPLWGRVDYFEITDTVEISLSEYDLDINWLELKLQMDNGFPLDAELDIAMVDEQYNTLDLLFDSPAEGNLIEAAPVDPQTHIVTQPRIKNTLIMLDEQKADNLQKASYLIITARLHTYNHQQGQSVKILDDYRLGLKMGARFEGSQIIEF